MLSTATYPSLQASYTNSKRDNKKSIPSLPGFLNIEKYSFVIHIDSSRDSYRSSVNISGNFHDISKNFHDISKIFHNVYETFHDNSRTFHDISKTFHDDNRTFHDDNKTIYIINKIRKNERVKLTGSPSALRNVRITIPITHGLIMRPGDAMNILFNKKVEAI